MKKSVVWAAIALMMATAITGCTLDSDSETTDPVFVICPDGSDSTLTNEDNELKYISLTRTEQELVNNNNDFAFNLFREIMNKQTREQSEIISPISITYALGMLNNGAAGDTQKQINKVLGFGEAGTDGINDFCKKMLTEASNLDKLTKVMIANTIYMNQGYQLNTDFVNKAKIYYDAEPETRNFADGKTREVINKWGSDHTQGMIPEVLKENEFDPTSISYLLNAIYFKGAWAERFDKGNTKDETFKGYNAKKQVPMMSQEHEFNYQENELCQALCLPYGNNAYRMTILLPKEGKTISDVLKTLTARTWQNYLWMDGAIVDVKLPRFESESDVKLEDIMSTLGMPNAFNPNQAEFPNFCNKPTFISMMKQVAKIKLNEEGTEAAAITVIGMKDSSSGVPSEPLHVSFHATRPFLYVISEQSTGTIFFIGKYVGD